jgi:hypothetical protein
VSHGSGVCVGMLQLFDIRGLGRDVLLKMALFMCISTLIGNLFRENETRNAGN